MLKLTGYVLVLSCVGLFLCGCAEEQKQAPSTVSTSQKSLAEQTEQKAVTEQVESRDNSEAEQKLTMAEHNMKMAQTGILSYSQSVALCRDIIKQYPDTQYERQAQDLLKQIPEDLRPKYNITDEELGL